MNRAIQPHNGWMKNRFKKMYPTEEIDGEVWKTFSKVYLSGYEDGYEDGYNDGFDEGESDES